MYKEKVSVKCPQCDKERLVYKSNFRSPKFTALCIACRFADHLRKMHERKLNRPLSERPITKRADGYLEVCLPPWHWCCPMSSKSRRSVMVHRLIMAEHLGRLLERKEIVHHKNGIRNDNRIENLELITPGSKHRTKYESGYAEGFKAGIAVRDKGLEKQMRLLQWQIRELTKSLQLKLEQDK